MSDGNFNRALLPKNELSAGLRAGKAQMRAKAEQALQTVLEEYLPTADSSLRSAIRDRFLQLLRQ